MNKINLDNWQFRKAKTETWQEAKIPGCIHTDLLHHKMIPDPYYRSNERELQWIGESSWEYQTKFTINQDDLNHQCIELICEGLDTYADIYINGEHWFHTHNMFRTWIIDLKDVLKIGENTILILFHSVYDIDIPKYDNAPYRLLAAPNNDQADIQIANYARKAGFHYGWDWGPRLISAGIWKPIYIRTYDDFILKNSFFRTTSLSSEKALCELDIKYFALSEIEVELEVHLDNQIISKKFTTKLDQQTYTISLEILKPELWWPNGMGNAHLYPVQITIKNSHKLLAEHNFMIGLRTIELVQEPDSFGRSFYLKVNGFPVFMKGANYIPQDNFQNRVSPQHYETLLSAASDAHMNMIRVWGGGIYEEDIFYELCDKKGLLVWQDFMFACGMFPDDPAYLDNVQHEIMDNVTRIRNHASLTLYCGNNENEVGWHTWGWKEKFSPQEILSYEKSMKHLFREFIPNILSFLDRTRPYTPSSPITGYPIDGEFQSYMHGDAHYWGVWHGLEPFENFEENIARFVSEYGFQSYPEFSSIKKYTIAEDWFLESDVMHSHQRCMGDERRDLDYGNRLIDSYMKRYFKTPRNFENYIYLGQVLQAFGVKMAVEIHRRYMKNKQCMGTLYWQLNDCWPVASWSSIDHYGKWKALHYYAKQFFDTYLVSGKISENKLLVNIVSDEHKNDTKAQLKIRLQEFMGKVIWEDEKSIEISRLSSDTHFTIDLSSLPVVQKEKCFFHLQIVANGQVLAENLVFFVYFKELDLPQSRLNIEITPKKGEFQITIISPVFVKDLYLSTESGEGFFSHNYIDLLPNAPKVIVFKGREEDLKSLKTMHLAEI